MGSFASAADAGAEKRGGGRHAVADGRGDGDGGNHDRKKLLDGGKHNLPETRFVLNAVSQIHCRFFHFHSTFLL